MGDCQNGDLRVHFDLRLKLKFLGSQVTTDAGLLAKVAVTRNLFAAILHRISRLAMPSPVVVGRMPE